MSGNAYKISRDVNVQDLTTDRISIFLAEIRGLIISMTGTAKDVMTFNIVTDGVIPIVGNFVCLQEEGKISQEEITVVVPVAGNEYTITIAIPLDFDYTTNGSCSIQNVDMDVNGATTEVIFKVGPQGNFRWDITRMMISMVLSSAGDDGLFGNLTSLTNGQYFRKEDSGTAQNLFNAKENSDFAVEGFDVAYTIRSGGQGDFGMRSRITFAGQDKSGVVIRLDGNTNDTFVGVVRDNLIALGKYRIKVQGHVVED